MNNTTPHWQPDSWRQHTGRQMPHYADQTLLQQTTATLGDMPALVLPEEIRRLTGQIAAVERGEAFLLQAGDCAESFNEFGERKLRATFQQILQMAVVLTHGMKKPVVKLGRFAGQYAKPRSSDSETQHGITLPSYRGDIINGIEFTGSAREPDPMRMLQAYQYSATGLNLWRALANSGEADLNKVKDWNPNFLNHSRAADAYLQMSQKIEQSLEFMSVVGIDSSNTPSLHQVDLFCSHEALLLEYEQALVRQDHDGQFYGGSGHMLWIGERTRQIDSAHVEFLRGIINPVGIKVGPTATVDEILPLLDSLNPDNRSGRITLITRMGANKIADHLPKIIRDIQTEGRNVSWISDPMHGNTQSTSNGYKTRDFNNILSEIKQFFAIHQAENSIAGGVHLELTGEHVTECIGGIKGMSEADLQQCYKTQCDPRLNGEQGLELAFLVAEHL
ncbi:Phospho-2-dehydro-3-deoxyheptonate aldolase [Sinobacterium norvegicum]|uniref:Phospho-2-dehydro-3-deoxyheptonate aldolase n=1 Tax=Sinobacterium norvegicum TaxID=1641715 RepID=A0ABN8EEF5_9GAMM|nr:3-deoxy-7-phosphoheptulonate synthase class II [Sinobacterium norvegicum]CAH0990070.1 Phospho-2-dehydro-3-deoxyheptonate aldolase [Sinobacterium norvegicum]